MGLQRDIDEAGTSNIDLLDQRVGPQRGGKRVGQVARLLAGVLGQDHRGVGRHVAMRRIARRLNDHARQIGLRSQHRTRGSVDGSEHGGEQMGGRGTGCHDEAAGKGFWGVSQKTNDFG
jgi:hypothetical protein